MLTARCPDNVDVVRDSVRRSLKKALWRSSQELGLSCALSDKVNQFMSLSSSLTFLKWYDYFLRLRWKMTWCNMNYYFNGLHLFWDTLYFDCRNAVCKLFILDLNTWWIELLVLISNILNYLNGCKQMIYIQLNY